jgi:hypothetical protein
MSAVVDRAGYVSAPWSAWRVAADVFCRAWSRGCGDGGGVLGFDGEGLQGGGLVGPNFSAVRDGCSGVVND